MAAHLLFGAAKHPASAFLPEPISANRQKAAVLNGLAAQDIAGCEDTSAALLGRVNWYVTKSRGSRRASPDDDENTGSYVSVERLVRAARRVSTHPTR